MAASSRHSPRRATSLTRTLADALDRVLELQLQFNALASPPMTERRRLLMEVIVPAVRGAVPETELRVAGSNGTGNNARVPWVRVFDPKQSPTPTSGWYVVLLFAADGSAASLSLNQGVTRSSQSEILRQVHLARNLLETQSWAGTHPIEGATSTIDLRDSGGLGAKYEKGNVLAFTYDRHAVPDDEVIFENLEALLARLAVFPQLSDGSTATTQDPATLLLADVASRIFWDEDRVLEVVESLLDESPQIVLSGPPGTGKTFVAQHLAAFLLDMPGEVDNNPYIETVQFHPSYGYEEFVEGLRPVPADAGFKFEAFPGVVLRMADEIAKDGLPRVLIIDEMNRANIPRVFGELMYLLEYRERDIQLLHRAKFSLPKGLYIVGTINTADRSVQSLDLALRRRFDFFDVPPDTRVLRKFFDQESHENALGEALFNGFDALNAQLLATLGPSYLVGHSYLMRGTITRQVLLKVWKRQLLPLLGDYFFDQPSALDDYSFERFW